MSIAKVVEITSESPESFEDAVRRGITKAGETLHGIQGAWVQEQMVRVSEGNISGYRVNLKVTFVLD